MKKKKDVEDEVAKSMAEYFCLEFLRGNGSMSLEEAGNEILDMMVRHRIIEVIVDVKNRELYEDLYFCYYLATGENEVLLEDLRSLPDETLLDLGIILHENDRMITEGLDFETRKEKLRNRSF